LKRKAQNRTLTFLVKNLNIHDFLILNEAFNWITSHKNHIKFHLKLSDGFLGVNKKLISDFLNSDDKKILEIEFISLNMSLPLKDTFYKSLRSLKFDKNKFIDL
jgi:hypothetical protein